ncbi:hypothetical protein PUP75_18440 [Pseudomonas chlororaphis]|uniref:hypothetical protein n=1 Tax=Pseudomonas chlororaphis TaxID=587753 RepID=UPI00236852D8|nr:hypothetical protein [Pseudomonas chlororaphis]WDH50929.1 hypothetical protein PUP75_18440 [Pseudomonas chlororaphis]
MANKKILTIGLSLADDQAEFCEFDSDTSLLDWDIILFKPDISEYLYRRESTFEGKPCLSDDQSFKLRAQSEHWRREMKAAIEHGKLVLVFLSELTPLSIATGKKEYSGTGRNQKVTRIVTNYDNYQSIPIGLKPIASKGKEIKLSAKNSECISSYWHEFSNISSYKVIVEGELSPCLLTKHGDKVVGTIFRSKNSNGALVCLPDIDFYPESFFIGVEDGENEVGWTPEAKQFASRMIKAIVSMEKSLRSSAELTPEPDWAKDTKYRLSQEKLASQNLLKIERNLEVIQAEKEAIIDEIKDLGRLRNLLFEKGKPLEFAILDALKIIGFEVSQFDDGESEFDAVFESKEGRLIGEAEGKDNKAINIDKLRQLAMNIHEDLERDEVSEPAKPVLFGNPYRLQSIDERPEPFTSKCISAAATSSTALVFTPDLFLIAKYLKDKRDARYAAKCRKAILTAIGKVDFPDVPKEAVAENELPKSDEP